MVRRAPDPIDQHVGSRVRARRRVLRMSQEKLAEALHLTFQQVQKYEYGTNRMGASRLHQIALVLQVPVGFFFEGAPVPKGWKPNHDVQLHVDQVLGGPEGLALLRAFGLSEMASFGVELSALLSKFPGKSDAASPRPSDSADQGLRGTTPRPGKAG